MKQLYRSLAVAALVSLTALALAVPPLAPYNLNSGGTFMLPQGWQVTEDEFSVIAYENPNDPDAAILGIFAFIQPGGTTLTPQQVAVGMLDALELEANGISAQGVYETMQNGALYQLHQLYDGSNVGYLSSYSYTDGASGAIYYLLFSALESSFVDLGGPALPLVAFTGLDASALNYDTNVQVPATQEFNNIEVTAENYEMLSQISAMMHDTTMKTLYNFDTGWCYAGEPGCF